jgi:RNA polymerase sigma factor (sigma-70 family)
MGKLYLGEAVDKALSDQHHAIIMDWVGREILPHEPVVRAWLRRSLGADELEDVIQQCYAQIAALGDVSHIRSGRAYFFTTARNQVLMRMRRARIVRIDTMAELGNYEAVGDDPSPERIVAGRSELARVRRLIDSLPPRCSQIMRLRKIDGLSQKEVAEQLGVPEYVVENDIAKGLKLILQGMAEGERSAERRLTTGQGFENASSRHHDR